ncbi:copper resistance protein CopC [Xanthobacter autotrophicus DSM 431]|uniref:copper resistance protein CopC n=1 Tax=Xanthobacter nonsaccharivorans TaxID=3119912 RepID=UPI0037275F97
MLLRTAPSARILAALALSGAFALFAAPAFAQCAFDQSSPNANDVVTEQEPAMSIQFMVEVELKEVRLLGPDKAEWPIDWVRSAGEVRDVAFRATKPLPPGDYMIEWNGYIRRHYHADGGSIPFKVAAAGPTPAEAPQAPAGLRASQGLRYPALLGSVVQKPGP